MSLNLKELRSLSTTELIERHDALAKSAEVGIEYYLEEVYRRDQEASAATMVKLTWWIAGMTGVVVLATIINVVLFVVN